MLLVGDSLARRSDAGFRIVVRRICCPSCHRGRGRLMVVVVVIRPGLPLVFAVPWLSYRVSSPGMGSSSVSFVVIPPRVAPTSIVYSPPGLHLVPVSSSHPSFLSAGLLQCAGLRCRSPPSSWVSSVVVFLVSGRALCSPVVIIVVIVVVVTVFVSPCCRSPPSS